jgi:cell wall-associated NlpC family hydrolase
MRLRRPHVPFLAALALLAAGAVGASVAAGGEPAAAPSARLAPVASPLPVPPVLELAAQRLESETAATHEREAAAPAPAPREQGGQTVDPATRRPRDAGARGDAALVKADVLGNGIALPPLDAPPEVRAIIEAGNAIARTPYKWGGGHGRWQDTGYDCSGSVSFALASAGLLGGPLDSGRLMSWGSAGRGRWITVWSNPGHVFLEVAGVRFDTSGTRVTGSRWQADMRSTAGFVARHPAGL